MDICQSLLTNNGCPGSLVLATFSYRVLAATPRPNAHRLVPEPHTFALVVL